MQGTHQTLNHTQKIELHLFIKKEYESILYERKLLKKIPSARISIEKFSDRSWGDWNPLTRVIRIQESLITQHSWDLVLEVLKHEIAHQINSELFKSRHEPPHGPSFLKACELLSVAPWARSASLDLGEPIPSWPSRCNTKSAPSHILKIKKLFALGQSSNQHEAELALKRAQEMSNKYGVSETDIHLNSDNENPHDKIMLTRHKKRMSAQEQSLYSLAEEFYGVHCVYAQVYSNKANQSVKAVYIVGRRRELQLVEYILSFLFRSLDDMWNLHLKSNPSIKTSQKRSYQLGVINGFRKSLALSSRNNLYTDPAKKLIIQNEKNLLDSAFQNFFPRVTRNSYQRSGIDPASYNSGKKDGRHLKINTPVSQTTQVLIG